MDEAADRFMPLAGLGDRVVGEDGFLPVIALHEIDAAPTADIDGRYNSHGSPA